MFFEGRSVATVYLKKVLHHRINIQVSSDGQLHGPTKVGDVVTHVADGSEANESLSPGFVVKLPVFVAIELVLRCTDLALESISSVDFFS